MLQKERISSPGICLWILAVFLNDINRYLSFPYSKSLRIGNLLK